MKVGISRDEAWPVYDIHDPEDSWAEVVIDVPQELLDRDKAAGNAYSDTQQEIGVLFKAKYKKT